MHEYNKPHFIATRLNDSERSASPHKRVTVDMLSPDQTKAFDYIMKWYESRQQQEPYLSLGGLAGTGKTTLVSAVANELYTDSVAFASYTGKAASVLHQKLTTAGVVSPMCSTLHSLIYKPSLHVCDNTCPKDDKCPKIDRIAGWSTKKTPDVNLIIVDEASMVPTALWQHLCSFGIPILAVGDHGQLPPIGSNPGLMINPDIRLEKIHRQASDNPIIALAHHIRKGGSPDDFKVDDSRLVHTDKIAKALDLVEDSDPFNTAVICDSNKTRVRANNHVRERLGHSGMPQPGEPVIALRNFPPVFNGLRGIVEKVADKPNEHGRFTASVNLRDDNIRITGDFNLHQFNRQTTFQTPREIPVTPKAPMVKSWRQSGLLFDYGYSMTCHKTQGSQFNNAVVLTGGVWGDSDRRKRWLYTAVTRASERLFVI